MHLPSYLLISIKTVKLYLLISCKISQMGKMEIINFFEVYVALSRICNCEHPLYPLSANIINTNIRRGADKSLAFPISPDFKLIILYFTSKFIVLYMYDLNFIIVA
jgi:hypothetical protein